MWRPHVCISIWWSTIWAYDSISSLPKLVKREAMQAWYGTFRLTLPSKVCFGGSACGSSLLVSPGVKAKSFPYKWNSSNCQKPVSMKLAPGDADRGNNQINGDFVKLLGLNEVTLWLMVAIENLISETLLKPRNNEMKRVILCEIYNSTVRRQRGWENYDWWNVPVLERWRRLNMSMAVGDMYMKHPTQNQNCRRGEIEITTMPVMSAFRGKCVIKSPITSNLCSILIVEHNDKLCDAMKRRRWWEFRPPWSDVCRTGSMTMITNLASPICLNKY